MTTISHSSSEQRSAAPSKNSSQKEASSAGSATVLEGEVVGADRAIPAQGQIKVIEDPLAEFVRENWRAVLITLAVAGALFYAVSIYRSTQMRARESSGDSFVGLQRTFNEFQELAQQQPDTDKAVQEQRATQRAELEKRLESQLKSLSFAKEPYPTFASFYSSLKQLTPVDAKSARTAVINEARFVTQLPRTIERLTAELLFLAAARGEIDADIAGARTALEKLAESGDYAAGAAAKTLLRIADTDESRAAAKIVVENVVARKPELGAELGED